MVSGERLARKDRYTNAHEESTYHQTVPILRECLCKHWEDNKQSGSKYGAPAAKESVHWVRCPCTEQAKEGWAVEQYQIPALSRRNDHGMSRLTQH